MWPQCVECEMCYASSFSRNLPSRGEFDSSRFPSLILRQNLLSRAFVATPFHDGVPFKRFTSPTAYDACFTGFTCSLFCLSCPVPIGAIPASDCRPELVDKLRIMPACMGRFHFSDRYFPYRPSLNGICPEINLLLSGRQPGDQKPG
jgi:hypothetical protein